MIATLDPASQEASSTHPSVSQVIFRVKAHYGAAGPAALPLVTDDGTESGPVIMMLDPHIDPSCNIGLLCLRTRRITIRHGIQIFFPRLFTMLRANQAEPGQCYPMRAAITYDAPLHEAAIDCQMHGSLDFLPGSIWSGVNGNLQSDLSVTNPGSFLALQEGRTVHAAHLSRVQIQWPAYLGDGATDLQMQGSLILDPLLAIT